MVNFLQTKQVSFSLKYSLDLLSISRKCWKAVFPCTVEQASASLKRIKPLQELRNLLHLLWECSNSGSKAKNILHNLYFYHWIFNGSCLMSVFLMVLVGMVFIVGERDPSEYSGRNAYRRSDLGSAEDLAELRWAINVLN
ncbi:uncharacterized protein LOC122574390 isoform X2 [Bombus pyrosoma]|uniref:uncharacterized protein LOC122574390 isoform X2 n=1 Tax=Bombus pyrosoma TaxID=396416 RepID=UPI001CB9D2EA|nr:uncharacterized protein LOC122574390 isoform X2 [Bombus pyrosoma]